MKRNRKSEWRKLVVLPKALARQVVWAAVQLRNVHDSILVITMMDKMKTACIGRFLVDAPRTAEFSLSSAHVSCFAIDTVLQFDNTVCVRNEVMSDIRALDDKTMCKRRAVVSSGQNSIAKPVSTLP